MPLTYAPPQRSVPYRALGLHAVQTYLCKECGYQFRNNPGLKHDTLWRSYQDGKQTISELAAAFGVSDSTSKWRLREIEKDWVQPPLEGSGFVHLDAT